VSSHPKTRFINASSHRITATAGPAPSRETLEKVLPQSDSGVADRAVVLATGVRARCAGGDAVISPGPDG
jgi:hypothetical protein